MSDVADLAEEVLDAERSKLGAAFEARLAPSGVSECEDCGDLIPPARLAVAPFARRCLHCQEAFERTHATR